MKKVEIFIVLMNFRKISLFFSVLVMAALTGCASTQTSIPLSELDAFTAKTESQRVLNQVRVRWDVRDDAAKICGNKVASLGTQKVAAAPIACAVWNVSTKECVIVTGRQVAHVTLGHELRHCFEGHFH